jgi:hypothetical protein
MSASHLEDSRRGTVRRLIGLAWAAVKFVGVLGFLAYLAFLGWREFGPRKPAVNALRQELAEVVLPQVIADLRAQRTNAAAAVFLHLAGDPTDHLSDRLRTLVSESGVLDLSPATLDERVQRSLNLAVTAPATLDAAVARARGLGAPAVLFGVVRQFDGTPQGGRLTLELTLADIATKSVLFTRTYDHEWKPAALVPATPAGPLVRTSLLSRLLGWALAVLLLPVFTIGFLRATVRRGSNRANLGILLLYTTVAAALAWLIVGAPNGLWPTVWLAVLAALAFAYHVWIMTVALRLEDQ